MWNYKTLVICGQYTIFLPVMTGVMTSLVLWVTCKVSGIRCPVSGVTEINMLQIKCKLKAKFGGVLERGDRTLFKYEILLSEKKNKGIPAKRHNKCSNFLSRPPASMLAPLVYPALFNTQIMTLIDKSVHHIFNTLSGPFFKLVYLRSKAGEKLHFLLY